MKVQMVDGQDIELYIYEPHADIRTRGVIQLVHGSCEHAGRYEAFINYLTDKGYIVYANDHRGHGKSVSSPEDYGYFGEEDGWQMMVDDLKSINDLIHAHNPELPIVMLGHSMGSFLARHYAIDYGETING
ncbi:alpha/beta fold hydrolase, partial [Turicibacter sanguinis]|nr:alpha/beta fold hydrolase [Turicibacter sanguinis]